MKRRAKGKPKAKSKVKPSMVSKSKEHHLLRDIWPQERHVLARPERLQYVRKLVPNPDCVFCAAEEKGVGVESLVLFKSEHVMVMLNKYPYNSGHLLVLPARHVGNVLELSQKEYIELQLQLRRAIEAIVECYQCSGFNLGMNHGKVAGAGIPEHLHWHVVPRWAGDTNFFPVIAESKVLVETLEQTFGRLEIFFKSEA